MQLERTLINDANFFTNQIINPLNGKLDLFPSRANIGNVEKI